MDRSEPKHMHSLPMASLLAITLCLLFSSAAASGGRVHSHRHPSSPKPSLTEAPIEIQLACNATRYPDACRAELAQSPSSKASPAQIIVSALSVSANNLKTAESMVNDILAASSGNHNRSQAAQTCLQLLDISTRRTADASDAVSGARPSLKDARAWASAAMVYQYDCWSALKYVNDTARVNETMSFMNGTLLVSTSNALSMLAAMVNFGGDTAAWAPPRTERDGFWEAAAAGGGGSELGFPAGLVADATVCAAGCDFTAVQKAVDAAPSNLEGGKRHVIRIREGVYEETVRVPYEKKNLVFVGDGIGRTVITGALNYGVMGVTTYNTATVGVFGDGFMASNLTIQNTAGPGSGQAVAFRSDSDLSLISNCEFLGNQDTLYAHSLRQLYRSCRIEGNIDFIFGMSASLFQNCTILVRPRQTTPEKGETNAVTAHGRTDPAMATGFAFFGCLVNGTDDYMKLYNSKPSVHRNYLGRPWKEYSRTVFIDSILEALISPPGWLPWTGDFALKTLYYGEYGNSGAGAGLAQRVAWSSRIPAERVAVYSAESFIQADEYSVSAAKSYDKKGIGM